MGARPAVRRVRCRRLGRPAGGPRRPDPGDDSAMARRIISGRRLCAAGAPGVVDDRVRRPRPRRARAVRPPRETDPRTGRPGVRELGPGRDRARRPLLARRSREGGGGLGGCGGADGAVFALQPRSSGPAPDGAATARSSRSRRWAATTCTTSSTTCTTSGTGQLTRQRPPPSRRTCRSRTTRCAASLGHAAPCRRGPVGRTGRAACLSRRAVEVRQISAQQQLSPATAQQHSPAKRQPSAAARSRQVGIAAANNSSHPPVVVPPNSAASGPSRNACQPAP